MVAAATLRPAAVVVAVAVIPRWAAVVVILRWVVGAVILRWVAGAVLPLLAVQVQTRLVGMDMDMLTRDTAGTVETADKVRTAGTVETVDKVVKT